ncbi:hypothetical protein FRC03_011762 [Tulasnella sp. 419]|nr:hypothetical protein FRC03_011762 [Tulasnella sp. 419]
MLPKCRAYNIMYLRRLSEGLPRWIRQLSAVSLRLQKVTIQAYHALESPFLRSLSSLPNLRHLAIHDETSGWPNILPWMILSDFISVLLPLQVFEWLPYSEWSYNLSSRSVHWKVQRDYGDIEALLDLISRCPNLSYVTLLLNANGIRDKLQRIEDNAQSSQKHAEQSSSLRSLRLIIFKLDPEDVELLARILVVYVSRSAELSIVVNDPVNPNEDNSELSTAYQRNEVLEREIVDRVVKIQAEKRDN